MQKNSTHKCFSLFLFPTGLMRFIRVLGAISISSGFEEK
jgi:hypothetical protein